MSDADAVIEVLRERLQIDVGRVDMPIELGTWARAHVAGGHRDRPHPAVVAGVCDIRRILPEDGWIVVGESHTAATQFVGIRATSSGVARPASVSASRDLEMSQFWQ